MAAPLFMQQRINANVNPSQNPTGPFFFSLEFQAWGSDLIRWRSIACFFWFGLAVLSVVVAVLMFGSANRPSGPTLALATLAFIATSFLLLSFDLSDMQVRGSIRPTRREKLLLLLKPSNIFRLLFNALFGASALVTWNILAPLGPGAGRLILPCGRSECAQIDVALSLLAGASAGVAFAVHYIYKQRTLLRFPSLHSITGLTQMNRLPRLRMHANSHIRLLFLLTFIATFSAFLLHFPFGRLVLRLLIKVMQPTSYTSLPLTLSLTSSVLLKTAIGCGAYLSLAIFARLLVEVLHTQWYPFETRTTARGQLLLHGMENPLPPLVHYLAMQDAVRVAECFSERRRVLFGADVADGRARDAWKLYCTRCITILDALTQTLRPSQDATSVAAPLSASVDPFTDYQLQAWAARALAGMVVASKTEDTYGIVQSTGSISAALQSLVNCLLAVESFLHSPQAPRLEGSHDTRPAVYQLHATLRTCVYAITTNFFEFLGGFSLPPPVALKLQSFVHFNE